MLRFEGVKKAYQAHRIIEISGLALPGGLYWLKGGNGAGKSTLLKMIAGMIPFDGSISISDTDLKKNPVAYRRLVNYVEAEPLYPPFLTGTDLIRFFTKARSADTSQVKFLREKMNVTEFEKKPINTYSSGMVKRLSLVLAFIGQPKFILLDEPLVTIDKDTIPVLYQLVTESAANGINFIVASHQALDRSLLPDITEIEIVNRSLSVTAGSDPKA